MHEFGQQIHEEQGHKTDCAYYLFCFLSSKNNNKRGGSDVFMVHGSFNWKKVNNGRQWFMMSENPWLSSTCILLVKLIHILMLEMYFVDKINLIIYVYENATNSSSLLWYDLLFQNNFTCYFAASPPKIFCSRSATDGNNFIFS